MTEETNLPPKPATSPEATGSVRQDMVFTNLCGSMLCISCGTQEVWLTRDEAIAVLEALPQNINHMPSAL